LKQFKEFSRKREKSFTREGKSLKKGFVLEARLSLKGSQPDWDTVSLSAEYKRSVRPLLSLTANGQLEVDSFKVFVSFFYWPVFFYLTASRCFLAALPALYLPWSDKKTKNEFNIVIASFAQASSSFFQVGVAHFVAFLSSASLGLCLLCEGRFHAGVQRRNEGF
jgi:hypothetical protein